MQKMKSPLSPSDIEVLVWCYCRPEIHPRYNAPAVMNAMRMFINCGMIESVKGCDFFTTTEKGKAMIDKLCKVDEPRQIYI